MNGPNGGPKQPWAKCSKRILKLLYEGFCLNHLFCLFIALVQVGSLQNGIRNGPALTLGKVRPWAPYIQKHWADTTTNKHNKPSKLARHWPRLAPTYPQHGLKMSKVRPWAHSIQRIGRIERKIGPTNPPNWPDIRQHWPQHTLTNGQTPALGPSYPKPKAKVQSIGRIQRQIKTTNPPNWPDIGQDWPQHTLNMGLK